MTTPLLEVTGLHATADGTEILKGIDLSVGEREVHALMGPNGAGKSTLASTLLGSPAYEVTAGTIRLNGEDVTPLSQSRRVRRGLARTFQINQLFPDLTPVESLGLALSERHGRGADVWRIAGGRADIVAEIEELLARFGLEADYATPTRRLPYGKQRLLEIALALACRPSTLLLDEPAAGVPEEERRDILEALAALPREVAILLIEHDMDLVFALATSISVLVAGRLLCEGTPAEIAADPRVRAVYLGEEAHG